jgi:hypothetical protein
MDMTPIANKTKQQVQANHWHHKRQSQATHIGRTQESKISNKPEKLCRQPVEDPYPPPTSRNSKKAMTKVLEVHKL